MPIFWPLSTSSVQTIARLVGASGELQVSSLEAMAAARAYELAQLNVGRLVAPLEDPRVAEFVDALGAVNELAENSPGFVWRFQTEEGDATAERPFEDDSILVNYSTWESIEALADFVYRTVHVDFLRRRREWFERMDEVVTVLWWVPAGHRPSTAEAIERLEHLRTHGPAPEAFTFRHPFDPGSEHPAIADETNACPA